MDPISITIASIITAFLVRTADGVTETVETAVTAPPGPSPRPFSIGSKPSAEAKTVERYEREPEKPEPSIAVAINDLGTERRGVQDPARGAAPGL